MVAGGQRLAGPSSPGCFVAGAPRNDRIRWILRSAQNDKGDWWLLEDHAWPAPPPQIASLMPPRKDRTRGAWILRCSQNDKGDWWLLEDHAWPAPPPQVASSLARLATTGRTGAWILRCSQNDKGDLWLLGGSAWPAPPPQVASSMPPRNDRTNGGVDSSLLSE